jgi:hypothetical protein
MNENTAVTDWQPFRYVTYLPDSSLDGCFYQEPPPEHLDRLIRVSEAIANQWVYYHANEARDGVEPVDGYEPIDPGTVEQVQSAD